MKTHLRILVLTTILISTVLNGQEKYGKTLNLGLGIGYYGYAYAAPALSFNYEFDVFENFTVAPFLGISSYRGYYYWGDYNAPYKSYRYRETVIPIGAKGSYYFDSLLEADEKWDFYAALSLGVVFRTYSWESGYYGDKTFRNYRSPIFANLHIGAEYHVSQKAGLFLDLSTGYSTVGLALHF